MTKKPIITYADMDIALFRSASSAEQIQYIYSDGDKEVARFNSASDGKKWLDEVEIMGCDFEYGYEGDHNTLTRSTDYIDLGVEKAYEVFDNILEDYKKIANTKEFVGYVSKSTGAEVFRNKIATIKKYKGSRASRKPAHLEAVRKYALSKPEIKQSTGKVVIDGVKYGIETDDQVAALAQHKGELGQLLSFDKDSMISVGCWILSPDYLEESTYADPTLTGMIKESGDNLIGFGHLFLLGMMITGDTADAITGVPKGGKKKALEVLSPFNNQPISELPKAFEEVAKLYKKAYGDRYEYKHWETGETIVRSWYEMMLEQGHLLYMVRGKDDSFEKSVLKYYKGETP
jgi:hypothetical protein